MILSDLYNQNWSDKSHFVRHIKKLAVVAPENRKFKNLMKIVRPKIIGTLKIEVMMAGNLAVKNDIKNAPNKIIVQCRSYEHGEEIIAKIKESKPGEVLHF